MYKEMVAMAVCTNNDQVEIRQVHLDGSENTIYVPLEQVDLLTKWISEAKAELTTTETFEEAIPNG